MKIELVNQSAGGLRSFLFWIFLFVIFVSSDGASQGYQHPYYANVTKVIVEPIVAERGQIAGNQRLLAGMISGGEIAFIAEGILKKHIDKIPQITVETRTRAYTRSAEKKALIVKILASVQEPANKQDSVGVMTIDVEVYRINPPNNIHQPFLVNMPGAVIIPVNKDDLTAALEKELARSLKVAVVDHIRPPK